MRLNFLFFLVLLAGCVEWPDTGAPPTWKSSQPWPVLLPIDQVTGEVDGTEAGETVADVLSSRTAALRARAAILRRNVRGQADMDALRARLAR